MVDVGDQKGQNRHQHLKVVTNTFCLQHPSPTSIGTKIKIIFQRMLKVLFETETPLPIDLTPVRDSNGRISNAFRPRKKLNPEQQNALMYGLAVKDVFCLHGPPGTGKSTVIGELVTILAKRKMKILIAAPSNAAVDVMIAKIAENLF